MILRIHLWCDTSDLVANSMATEPFLINIFAHVQALVGFESGIRRATASQRVTDAVLAGYAAMLIQRVHTFII